MNYKVFNVCMALGWLQLLVGGILISPGWGIAIAGAVLLGLTMAMAYLVGISGPAKRPDGEAKAG